MSVVRGPVTQIAWVVTDIAASEKYLGAMLGGGKWTRIPDVAFGPENWTYRGEPADFTAHVSMTYQGDTQLELIQPVRGASIYAEFLERGGPGLHHICFEPEDFDTALKDAAAQGVGVVQQGSLGGEMRFAYLDGAAAGVPYIELAEVGPNLRKLYEKIKKDAA
ncbi:VOC family protein [Nocardia sp. NPDC051030]|uniref:VOC family protein n=1 Tax=Nocardia sp. NPDC051030 TaxID=3155162 RepID=UPI00343BD97B